MTWPTRICRFSIPTLRPCRKGWKANSAVTQARSDYAARLKKAIADGIITVMTTRQTELIKITMANVKPEDARQIVDAFIRAYMALEGLKSTQAEDQTLNVLEGERRTLADKLESQREAIRQLAQEYGTVSLR